MGDLIGYQTRYDRQVSDSTRIRFLTEGFHVGFRPTQSLKAWESNVDEFHERSVAADLVWAVRQLQETSRPELRLVPMSATLDANALSDWLGCSVLNAEGRIPGRYAL